MFSAHYGRNWAGGIMVHFARLCPVGAMPIHYPNCVYGYELYTKAHMATTYYWGRLSWAGSVVVAALLFWTAAAAANMRAVRLQNRLWGPYYYSK